VKVWTMRGVMIVSGVVFLAAFAGLSKLRVAVTGDDLIETSFRSHANYERLHQLFPIQPSAYVVFSLDSGTELSTPLLCELEHWTDRTRTNGVPRLYSHVFSGFDVRLPHLEIGSTGSEKMFYPRVVQDPCSSDNVSSSRLEALARGPWGDLLTDRTGRDFLVEVDFVEKTPRSGADPERVEDLMKSLPRQQGMSAHWSGAAIYQYYLFKAVARSQILNLAALIAILVFLRFVCGTWRAGALFSTVLILAVVLVHGGMGWADHPINTLSMSVFFILALSALEDFIFLSHFRAKQAADWRLAFRSARMPGFFTSLTTTIGFGSLLGSELSTVRHFALWSASGAMVEWAATFWVLPALLEWIPYLRDWVVPHRAPFLRCRWFRFHAEKSGRLTKYLARASLLVFVGAMFGIQSLKINSNPLDALPADHPFSQAREYLKKTRGWEAQVQLVFEKDVAPARVHRILANFKTQTQVAHLEGGPVVEEVLVKDLPPLTRELVMREYRVSGAGERYFASSGESKVDVFLKSAELSQVRQFVQFAESACGPDCFVSGDLVAFVDAADPLIRTLYKSMWVSLGLVSVLLIAIGFWLQLGFRAALAGAASSVWGSAGLICLMAVFNMSVSVVSCVVLSVLIGMTGDNLIQYLFAGGKDGLRAGLDRVGSASIHCSLIMIVVSLLLSGSYVRDLRSLGFLLASGFLLSLTGDFWILQGILK